MTERRVTTFEKEFRETIEVKLGLPNKAKISVEFVVLLDQIGRWFDGRDAIGTLRSRDKGDDCQPSDAAVIMRLKNELVLTLAQRDGLIGENKRLSRERVALIEKIEALNQEIRGAAKPLPEPVGPTTCSRCGSERHMAQSCRTASTPPECSSCGSPLHKIKECPFPDGPPF